MACARVSVDDERSLSDDRLRHVETDRRRGLRVDDEFPEFRHVYSEVAGPLAAKDPGDVARDAAMHIDGGSDVAVREQESLVRCIHALRAYQRKPPACREIDDLIDRLLRHRAGEP